MEHGTALKQAAANTPFPFLIHPRDCPKVPLPEVELDPFSIPGIHPPPHTPPYTKATTFASQAEMRRVLPEGVTSLRTMACPNDFVMAKNGLCWNDLFTGQSSMISWPDIAFLMHYRMDSRNKEDKFLVGLVADGAIHITVVDDDDDEWGWTVCEVLSLPPEIKVG